VAVISLFAALAFAASSSLKHASAGAAPDAQSLRPSKVAGFVRATVSHRLWLIAIVCDVAGLVLQIWALHLGALAFVQPLLISGLLFALILKKLVDHDSLSHAQLGWALVLTVALGGFLVLAQARPPVIRDHGPDRLPALIAGLVGLLFVALFVLAGRQRRGRASAAAMMGIAVGTLYAGTAALLKGVTDIGAGHPSAIFGSWQLYAVIVLGAAGLLLNQLAFQAGPLSASLPAAATVDPLLSIVIGVTIFDEHIRRGLGAGSALTMLLILMGVAVIQLSRRSAPSASLPRETSDEAVSSGVSRASASPAGPGAAAARSASDAPAAPSGPGAATGGPAGRSPVVRDRPPRRPRQVARGATRTTIS
jgi:EamA domain-containing membrane protein RarD